MVFIKNLRFSIRTIVGLIIILMGALGLIFALGSGIIHSNLVFNNHRDALVDLVRLKSSDLIAHQPID